MWKLYRVNVLTQDVSVAEMWRRRWWGGRRWSEGGWSLPEVGVGGAGGGGHGWWGGGRGGGQILEVLLPWFFLLKATPWIHLQTRRNTHWLWEFILLLVVILMVRSCGIRVLHKAQVKDGWFNTPQLPTLFRHWFHESCTKCKWYESKCHLCND